MFRSLLLTGHTERVTQLAWSPDGRILASAATGQGDLAIRLWATDGRLLATLYGHSAPILSLAWSPDGRMLASGSADKTVRLWNPDGSTVRTLHVERGSLWAVAWSPDGQFAAVAAANLITVVRSDGTHLAVLRDHTDLVNRAAWSPAGSMFASSSDDKTIRLWYLPNPP